MRTCALDFERALRASLDRDTPQWTVEQVWCPLHRESHELRRDREQIPLLGRNHSARPQTKLRTVKPVFLEQADVWCVHENSTPALVGACAYCGTTLHVHQDALGSVKSGRHEKGYLEEPCPACHRPNAVYPAYGLGGIRTSQLTDDGPVMQLKMMK